MIGIFIGSFNPPTLAHLSIALKLKDRYEKIVFIPVNTKEKNLVSMKDRIEMLDCFKRKYPFILIDDMMDNYSYLNYRIIDILKKKYQNIELIIGSDLLKKIDKFDNYEYLVSSYSFMVVTRDGMDVEKIIQEKYFNYQKNFHQLELNSDISSSIVREKLKKNLDVKNILDCDVYLYIKNKNLYF